MKIGIDLRALQIGHEYRGIGELVRRTLHGVFEEAIKDGGHEFVFFEYDDKDPKQFLDIPDGLKYTEVDLGLRPLKDKSKLSKKISRKLKLLYGSPLDSNADCDVFVQFDYTLGVPRRPKSLVYFHDLIPYIYWSHYFTSPKTHIKNRALRTTLRTILHNYTYKQQIKHAINNSTSIVTISDHTKNDLIKFFNAPAKKIRTIHLGVSKKPLADWSKDDKESSKLPTKPFLLFIGASEYPRRDIDGLVAAFNNLKAHGRDIQLALVGENFKSAETIPVEKARQAVLSSSYKDDILCLGYINDATKYQLYKDAVAFVFPSNYEGFGIPVLESMLFECPVISYKNSSIPEIGGKYVHYANDWEDIWHQTEKVMSFSSSERSKQIVAAKRHAEKFSWDKSTEQVFKAIKDLKN